MKKLLIALCLICSLTVFAQGPGNGQGKGPKQDKKEWLAKMREYKHAFITKELNLTADQQTAFFAVYDKMMEERMALEDGVRTKERALIKKGTAATDAELDALITEQYALDSKLAAVDAKYLPQLKKAISRQQLVRLKHAERKFNRQLMEQRNKPDHK